MISRSRFALSTRTLPPPSPSTSFLSLSAGPSGSRHFTRSFTSLWKGKRPATSPSSSPLLFQYTFSARQSRRKPVSPLTSPLTFRLFHATTRRDAIPLIPATLGIIKSGSILTLVTAISRVLISFVPLGTIAGFRLAHGARWLSSQVPPDVSPEAEEFWKMWCRGEKGIRLTRDDAEKLLDGELLENGMMVDEDGRQATRYVLKPPPGKHISEDRIKAFEDPRTLKGQSGFKNSPIRVMRFTRFFRPALPAASISYYDRLTPDVRSEVDSLRDYYMSIDRFRSAMRRWRWAVSLTLLLPFILLGGTYLFGLEKTPLTGRWRIILLTPEEEDKISTSLAGPNWYRSVINLLTTAEKPAPPLVSYNDWRWRWVQGVLRQLESAAVQESKTKLGDPPLPPGGVTTIIPPPVPPAAHDLRPRPRMSQMLHGLLPGGSSKSGTEHLELGPPYSLMLLEKDEQNAFSYGFGGKGAGGVVVYSGLLDHIIRSHPSPSTTPSASQGWFSSLFSPTPRPTPPQPTPEQNLHLACVLAHEMGHLLLSHHLETLSQQQVLWPSVLGLSMDLARAIIWPLTIFLGPTVNDALANVGKTSTEEISERYGHIGFQYKHEYEADLAGLRLLALAGFDPHAALYHFATSVADLHEIGPANGETHNEGGFAGTLFKLWTQATHPSPESRVKAVESELKRWEEEAKRRPV